MPKKKEDTPEVIARRMEVGERIRKMVAVIGTQAKAAEVAGVSVQQLSRFMNGKNSPSFGPMTKLANASQMNLQWVATGVGDPFGREMFETQQRAIDVARFTVAFMERMSELYASKGMPFVDDDQVDAVTGDCLERINAYPVATKDDRDALVEMVVGAHSAALDHASKLMRAIKLVSDRATGAQEPSDS